MSISRRAYLSVATLAASSMAVATTSGAYGLEYVTSGLWLTQSDSKSCHVLSRDL